MSKIKTFLFIVISLLIATIAIESILKFGIYLTQKGSPFKKISQAEKDLLEIRKKNEEKLISFNDHVTFTEHIWYGRGQRSHYIPRANIILAIPHLSLNSYPVIPLNEETKPYLDKFDGKILYRHYDEHSLRVTGVEGFGFEGEPSKRVLMVGDSFTEGVFVEDDETFSSQLEMLANKNNHNIEVLNSGIAGYSTKEEYFRMMELLNKIKVDLVVLHYFPNDINTSEHEMLGYARRKEPKEGSLKWLYDKVGIARVLIRSYYHFVPHYIDPTKDARVIEGWRTSASYLEKMKGECDKRGIPFFLSVIPPKEQFEFKDKTHYQEKLRAFCEKRGIGFLDPYEVFAKNNPREVIYLDWDPHFKAEGHEIYSEFLYSSLKDRL